MTRVKWWQKLLSVNCLLTSFPGSGVYNQICLSVLFPVQFQDEMATATAQCHFIIRPSQVAGVLPGCQTVSLSLRYKADKSQAINVALIIKHLHNTAQ